MGPFVDFFSNATSFMPWVSFAAGLGGGLHCVGMCGGLVTASCERGGHIVSYQLGRLGGYLLLGAVGGLAGGLLRVLTDGPWPAFLGGTTLGLLFIVWGVQSWRGRKAELPLPKFTSRWYGRMWLWSKAPGRPTPGPALTGLLSILLPCGLLYGVALAAVALQNPLAAMASMAFFWLGTLPSMILAPHIVRRILAPLKAKAPRICGVVLMIIGLATIGHRVGNLSTHAGQVSEVKEHKCH